MVIRNFISNMASSIFGAGLFILTLQGQCQTPQIQTGGSTSGENTFCAFGDWGEGSRAQRAVAASLFSQNCNHIFLLGDNFYPRGVRSTRDRLWEIYFQQIYNRSIDSGARFHPVLGNHDALGSSQAQIDYSSNHPEWVFPSRYYRIEFPIARSPQKLCVLSLDTTQPSRAQATWIRQQIQNKNHCAIMVALGHHPFESSGYHGPTGGGVARILRPALEGIDVYLCGHEHHFADEGWVLPHRGTGAIPFRQLTVGTGGAVLYRLHDHRAPDHRLALRASGLLRISPQEQRTEFSFVDTYGRVRYSWTWDRHAARVRGHKGT